MSFNVYTLEDPHGVAPVALHTALRSFQDEMLTAWKSLWLSVSGRPELPSPDIALASGAPGAMLYNYPFPLNDSAPDDIAAGPCSREHYRESERFYTCIVRYDELVDVERGLSRCHQECRLTAWSSSPCMGSLLSGRASPSVVLTPRPGVSGT